MAQAITVYVMSCFLLPISLCEDIERAVCNFWWEGSDNSRKIHWTSKAKLFKPKKERGMGFKILRDFNLAMLAKQIWRLHTNPNSLLAQCYQAKYHPKMRSLKLLCPLTLVMLGGAYIKQSGLIKKVVAGEQGMGTRSGLKKTSGFLYIMVSSSLLLTLTPTSLFWLRTFFKIPLLTGFTISYMTSYYLQTTLKFLNSLSSIILRMMS